MKTITIRGFLLCGEFFFHCEFHQKNLLIIMCNFLIIYLRLRKKWYANLELFRFHTYLFLGGGELDTITTD